MKNIAVIGCGYWGKNLVRNFYELGALAAVCDPVKAVAEDFSKRYEVPAKTWNEVLADPSIQGVVLAVPAVLHANMCCEAIRHHKDVYVEKPLSLTVEEGETIKKTLEGSSQILLVGHLLQYHPAIEKIKDCLRSGVIGSLKAVRSHRFNLGKIRHEENVLWSFAPHDFSVIYSLVQSPLVSIQSVGQRFFNDTIYDRVDISMVFESGVHAEVCVSWVHPFKEQKLVVIGTQGMLVFDDTLPLDQKLKLYPHQYSREGKTIIQNKADPEILTLASVEPLKAECSHFLECIVSRRQPRTDIDEGIAVIQLLQSAQKGLK